MKEITLSLAHYKAIKMNNGVHAAVEALRSDIQKLAPDLSIELQHNGPNRDHNRVASLAFVRAAILRPSSFGAVEPNLLTCGFARADRDATAGLFTVLTNPEDLLPSPENVIDGQGEGDAKEVIKTVSRVGLVVGSFKNPAAFITFDR